MRKKYYSKTLFKVLTLQAYLLLVHSLIAQPRLGVQSRSMNMYQNDYQPYQLMPGLNMQQTNLGLAGIFNADAQSGISLFSFDMGLGAEIDPTGEVPGWKVISLNHKFISKPNPPTPSMATIGQDFEVINHGLTVFGTPENPGHFRGNVIENTEIWIDRAFDQGGITITKEYFPEDDPATPQNEESYMPYVAGGKVDLEIINPTGVVVLQGEYTNEAKTGPNIGKLELPAGLIVVQITTGFTNLYDIDVGYAFRNVCAYNIEVKKNMVTTVMEVSIDPQNPSQYIADPNPYIVNKVKLFEFTWTDNVCPKPIAYFKNGECSSTKHPYAGSLTFHPVQLSSAYLFTDEHGNYDPTTYNSPKYDYATYRLEAYLETSGYYYNVGTHITNTIAYDPSDPIDEISVSLSNYPYLPTGYYMFHLTPINAYGVHGQTTTCDVFISSGARLARGDNNVAEGPGVHVYPNPFYNSNGFNIDLKGLQEREDNNVHISIYDLLGNHVYNNRYVVNNEQESIHIDIGEEVSSGIYLLNVSMNGTTFNRKIQVE